MKNVFFLLYGTLFSLLLSCNKPGTESVGPDPSSPERGVVKGRVVDAQGLPVRNAEIVASSTDYYSKTSTGYTDADGYYRFTIPTGIAEGSYSADGTLTIAYHGKQVKVALYRSDSRVFSAYDGAVRNFVFRLTGPRSPDDDDYATPLGATLEVHPHPGRVDASQVDIILEPVGALLDGSTGKKLTLPLGDGSTDLEDIPLGYYKITARNRSTGQLLGVKIKDTSAQYTSSLTSLFEDDNFEGSTEFRLVLLVDTL
ncbi:carboxypeptidase-like regulatory domain-containing protein [Spirosoma gilvum]